MQVTVCGSVRVVVCAEGEPSLQTSVKHNCPCSYFPHYTVVRARPCVFSDFQVIFFAKCETLFCITITAWTVCTCKRAKHVCLTCDYVHLYNFFVKHGKRLLCWTNHYLEAQNVFDFNKAFDTLIHNIFANPKQCVHNDGKKSSILKLIKGYHKAQFLAQICVCHICSSVCKDQKHMKKKGK